MDFYEKPKKLVLFSIFLASIGVLAYFLEKSLFNFICGDKFLSASFSSCGLIYKKIGLILQLVSFTCSFILSLVIILKDTKKTRFYVKGLIISIVVIVLLACLFWDDSGHDWLSINGGEIIIHFGILLTLCLISSIAWSYLFKHRIFPTVAFLFLCFFAISQLDDWVSNINQNLIGTPNSFSQKNDCNQIIVGGAKDNCVKSDAIRKADVNLCQGIKNTYLKKECRDYIFRNVGSATKNRGICEMIDDPYQKSLCLQ